MTATDIAAVIRDLNSQGLTDREIATHLRIHPRTVNLIRAANNIPTNPHTKPRDANPDRATDPDAAAIRAYATGVLAALPPDPDAPAHAAALTATDADVPAPPVLVRGVWRWDTPRPRTSQENPKETP